MRHIIKAQIKIFYKIRILLLYLASINLQHILFCFGIKNKNNQIWGGFKTYMYCFLEKFTKQFVLVTREKWKLTENLNSVNNSDKKIKKNRIQEKAVWDAEGRRNLCHIWRRQFQSEVDNLYGPRENYYLRFDRGIETSEFVLNQH